jgi:hypothetical protein
MLVPEQAFAAEFWVDPVHGEAGNDGSSSAPWRSLQEVLDKGFVESQRWESLPYEEGATLVAKNTGAPVKAGDTIYLRSGYHGDLFVLGHYNRKAITVSAEHGHKPRFRSVLVRSGSNWVFRGLDVSPEYAPRYERTTLFHLESHGWHGPIHDIVVEDCHLHSIEDSSKWTAEDWDKLACDGLEAHGKNITLRNNVLRNVNSGISVDTEDSLIEGNLVENFAGDGMRGFGNRTVFQYNTIKNCYDVNDNHDDGFQSWSSGKDGVGTGEVVGIVLRGNTFINNEDPNQLHRGALQGIGCFDGTYVDWVIENNVIIVDHWHGITLLGARNIRVVNNTVLDSYGGDPGPPWIMIGPHKDGTPSDGSVIRNNLTTAIQIEGKGVTADHNMIIKNADKIFVDAAGHDLRLKKGSKAVDAGNPDLAPNLDRDKVPRPSGDGYDIGAYEFDAGKNSPGPREREDPGTMEAEAARHGPAPVAPDGPQNLVKTIADDHATSAEGAKQSRFGSITDWLVALLVVILLYLAWRL